MPRQKRFSTTPASELELAYPKKHHHSSKRTRSSRSTRSQTAETESLELASLNERGLYALPTEGDGTFFAIGSVTFVLFMLGLFADFLAGNCLYYALSDQLYGDFTHADEIRCRLADHIQQNKDYFMSFISANGGLRRAPRRAAASTARYSSSSSSSASPAPPSSREKEESFESKVAASRQNGVWGGAEEIQAFCQSYRVDVHVYTTYGVQRFRDVHAPQDEIRDVLQVAFHVSGLFIYRGCS